MIFLAGALIAIRAVAWVRQGQPAGILTSLIGYGLTSVSGMLLFMIYLFVKFHDPFVFLEAQAAWAVTPFSEHASRLFLGMVRCHKLSGQ